MTWEAIPCPTHLELQHWGGRGRKNRGIKVIFGDIASSRRAWLQPQIPLAAPPQCLSYTSPTRGAIHMVSYSTSILPLTITSKLDFSSKITYGNCLVNSHHSLGQWEMDKYHYLVFEGEEQKGCREQPWQHYLINLAKLQMHGLHSTTTHVGLTNGPRNCFS